MDYLNLFRRGNEPFTFTCLNNLPKMTSPFAQANRLYKRKFEACISLGTVV